MEKAVLFEVRDEIAIITLNRPEKRNSINRELLAGLYDAIEEVSRNENIKVGIITGNGKSFCAGIDLSVIGKENLFDIRGNGIDLPDIFGSCRKPLIGAINGHAITGGFEIALNCDFLIASDNAMFADTHAKVGIHPGWGMTQLLQQAVGKRRAKQMSLTCQFITAEEALKFGLVNEVVPQENLMNRTIEIAKQICENKYDMVITVRDLINYRDTASMGQALAHERERFRRFVKKNMPSLKGSE
ncbi:MAG: 2,3-dehydroadipyl-CoA hydratase [Spirochaetes bacterium ADurb.Bin218]|jgi:enoyl-CoA hydratase|nr:enoyl-CoA hydratase [Spirochaetota bacterium]OQA98670.1 MAG: 2,3-dehydroadipyl-CoA hydratase [Spirochaetes bacterium ADurb.Bin218]HOQ10916.1 enoyl-CoA hydratase [Spirochaetota bacterium]HOV08032.1 enoyl-CoA hydratase [Spirochaetota bacterium]HPX90267.1 enoyl-CoA hydratase [Spirochaetota bacterium]